jgi:hypothetical protein
MEISNAVLFIIIIVLVIYVVYFLWLTVLSLFIKLMVTIFDSRATKVIRELPKTYWEWLDKTLNKWG